MRYGVVVHGPEVVDSGVAARFLDVLGTEGEVSATLGGAMGLAALLDAGLEERVTVVPRQLVSDALVAMDRSTDVVVLLNKAKDQESGSAFGRMVVGRCRERLTRPAVQIDDGFWIRWRDGPLGALPAIIDGFGLSELPRPVLEDAVPDLRQLHGVRPGESIWINGTVIGRATSPNVAVRLVDGRLEFENVAVKAHGLDKVRVGDLRKAIIRSGSVRRTSSPARRAVLAGGERMILVDHRAEDAIFRARGARAAVTVGDDTTRISTSLLARLGVPVIGIVDGDEDGICLDSQAADGSVRIVLRPGNDDQLGQRVRQELFGGREEAIWAGPLESLVSTISGMAGDALLEVRKK